ncbi:transcription factor [Fusarium langsethiae]|uniref:Transcription factor n=1 Tax=Fusarium langsethiae TaxID=179993 RepID=A0A0N0DD86_FUSLA|nr:transcription factor [Fusarium langsethiae]
MPGSSNFFLPPSAPPSTTFDTKELSTALQNYETSIREQQLHDHQFSQLQTLTEVAESPSSSAIVPDAIPKKRSSRRDSTRVSSSRSQTTSRSSRHNKNVLQTVHDQATSAVKRCDLCGASETPRWRENPVGAGLLCNVCGLVQTKRIARKNLTLSREYTSTMGSSHR